MRAVFLKILGFVILIDLFYMGIGQWWLTQAEEHPPPELQITVETNTDTLVGMGETLLKAKGGCLLCHKITDQGNTRGPDLRGVGGRAATRKPGLSAEAYLTESLLKPGAYVVEGFATAGGTSIMPAADQPPADLSPTELKALVAFLQSLGGEVTIEITALDVKAAEAKKKQPPSAASTHPGATLLTAKGCVACHDVTGTARRVGPPLTDVGQRLSAAEIRQSIVDPNAVIAEGYPKDVMLKDFAERLTSEELDQLVSYLAGEVSLGDLLSHPAVHLLALILLFNGGVSWAMRKVASPDRAAAPGELVPTGPGGIARGADPAPGLPGQAFPNQRFWRLCGAFLGAVVLTGGLYLGIEARSPQRAAEKRTSAPVEPTTPETAADGRALYMQTCPACHGPDAKGLPGLGKDMTTSEFIKAKSDGELVEFIKAGRAPDDPLNTTGVPMPPKGANPALTDADILAIVKFIRSLNS